ncbi:MAG: MBL fold metallo-hydrolase [Calditrichaeota bacterium]|nr:MAG: MBL fold metallo-hydrolase [Calditrichota bacterium]MBL1205815.1 MBL fold metallo-hydrolase [Calditrichota bacterium]NOG45643.1 MBL fold metallo-hydrolase [Calditrichota bacterium]
MKLLSTLILLFTISFVYSQDSTISEKAHHVRNGFKNPYPGFEEKGISNLLKWVVWDRFINDSRSTEADSVVFELAENDPDWLQQNKEEFSITWVGHSSFLIQIEGLNILTDPVWSERVSPVSFVGPSRLVKPGLAFDSLPPIDIVIISHDHYDHLDEGTIEMIGDSALYIVPLGIGDFLDGLDISNYQELDWWDEISFNGVRFICTPTQHFSGRTLFDRNKTLWSSWAILGKSSRLYFAGDTGYFPGFKQIGERYGPFDVAIVPIGAYKPQWFMSPVHVDPVQAVDVYLDVKAKYFVPMHWGTFQLSDEPITDPPKVLMNEVELRGLDSNLFKVLKHGETIIVPVNNLVSEKPEIIIP